MRDRQRRGLRTRGTVGLLVGLLAGLLSGCSGQGGWLTTLGPDFHLPTLPLLDHWSTPASDTTPTTAAPDLSNWWSQFQDPVLTALQQQAQADSATLAQIAARIAQARAEVTATGGTPDLTLTADASHGKAAMGTSLQKQQQATLGLQMAWELDLFGGIARGREAATAQWRQEQANWHAARLSLSVEVADAYGRYRFCQRLAALSQAHAQAAERTLAARQQGQQAGFLSVADLSQTQTATANARQQAQAQAASCQQEELALATLTASPDPEALRRRLQDPVVAAGHLPTIPAVSFSGVPAEVLTQRPDVAASERAVAAASARIGVAEAARYPALRLTGMITPMTLKLGSAEAQHLTPWSIGPSLSLPLFDGGERAAREDAARSAYQAAESQYRATVRQAVQEVEESLTRLNASAVRLPQARSALHGQQQALTLGLERHQLGLINAVEREALRQGALMAEQDLAGIELEQWRSWLALYRAVGGDWQQHKEAVIPGANGDDTTTIPPAPEVPPTLPTAHPLSLTPTAETSR